MQIREVEVRHILARSKLSNKGYTINPYVCDNNINAFAFIGPILPGTTDLKMIFASLEGKVAYVFGETLNTHCGNMPQILKAVSAYDPKLRPFFVQAVDDRQYWETIEQEFHALAKKHDIHVAGFFHHVKKSEA